MKNFASKTAVLVMAAGESSRFGGSKVLAELEGKSLLKHAIDTANSSMSGHVYVVSGAYQQECMQHLALDSQHKHYYGGATLLYNMHWQAGLHQSIARGVQILQYDYDAILILLADQIAIQPKHIQSIFDQAHAHPEQTICAFYNKQCGLPALVLKRSFPALCDLKSEHHLKQILQSTSRKVSRVTLPSAIVDIDTRNDLKHAGLGAKLDQSPIKIPESTPNTI